MKNTAPSREQLIGLTALYKQGKLQEALSQGEALAKQFPTEPITANLLGAVYVEIGRLEQAVASYTRALQIRPDFAEAHSNLGNVLKRLGKPEEAVASYRRALQIRPDYAEAHCNLGDVLNEMGRHEEAVASYRRALHVKPDFAVAHNNLGTVLNELGKPEEAITSLARALQIQPNFAEAHNNLGAALNELGKPDAAISSLTRALQIRPDYAEAHSNLGDALNNLGRSEHAMATYENALRINPAYATVHRSLSAIKNFTDGDPQIFQMRQLIDQNELSDGDRIHLNFALAKAHEDIGDYDQAFSYFAEGNRLRKRETELRYFFSTGTVCQCQSDLRKICAALSPSGDAKPAEGQTPVFVLGMPRSGTTLVEQILASHSQVYGAGELILLGQSIHSINRTSTQLTLRSAANHTQSYLSGLARVGASESYVTDKMPINFLLDRFHSCCDTRSKDRPCKERCSCDLLVQFQTLFLWQGKWFRIRPPGRVQVFCGCTTI